MRNKYTVSVSWLHYNLDGQIMWEEVIFKIKKKNEFSLLEKN